MKRSRERATAAIAVIATIAAGCGGGDVELSTDASARLEEVVRAARDSAAESDVDGAANYLETLRVRIDELQEAGEVSEARARSILAAVEEVDALLEADPEPVEPEPTGQVTDDSDVESGREDEDEGKVEDRGKGEDRGRDEGGGEDKGGGSGRGKGKDDD